MILGFNARSILLRLVQHPTSQGGRHQHTAAAPRPAPTGHMHGPCPAARGPAGPAVAAAAGRQAPRPLAIGTALTAVCTPFPAPHPRPPRPFLKGHQPGGNPAAACAPIGHAARQALDASPSPQAAGPRQAPARLGRKPPRHPVYSVYSTSGAQVPRDTCQLCTETEEQCSAMKSKPEGEDQDVKKNTTKKNIM